MHAAVRPYAMAGVVLVGASILAVTPIAPPQPAADLHVANPAVQLTAAVNSIQFYEWVYQETLANAGALLEQYLTVPPELVEAFITQPIQTSEAAFTVLTRPVNYLVGAWSLVNPVASGITAGVAALTEVVRAVVASNPIDLFNAIVNIPGWIFTGVFQGAWLPIPLSGELIPGNLNLGGLLTRYKYIGNDYIELPGLLGFPIYLAQQILNAVPASPSSTPLAPVNEPPTSAGIMLTLNTTPVVNSGSTLSLANSESDTAPQAQEELDTATAEAVSAINEPTKAGPDTATAGPDTATAGAATATNEPTKPASDTSTQVQRGLDTSVAGAANATDGLAQARSNASTRGQHGLDTATSAINNPSTDIRDGNKVQPGQVGENSAPSGGDAVKAAKPVGEQIGSTRSMTGNETKKAEASTGTRGSQG
jgi:hypothetical protein